MRNSGGSDAIRDMILRILEDAKSPLSTLGVNYMINEAAGRMINLNTVKESLVSLVKSKKVSERLDDENGVTYYKLLS